MILSYQIQRLGPHLDALALVMNQYQEGALEFPESAVRWLEAAEQILGSLRVRDGSEVAILRGRILKAADDLQAREDKPARSRIRRARNAAAADALERAEKILRDRVRTAEDRLGLFEDKVCEGITALALKVDVPSRKGTRGNWLQEVWGLLNREASTRPLAIYLAASLSVVDRMSILGRVLDRLTAPVEDDVSATRAS